MKIVPSVTLAAAEAFSTLRSWQNLRKYLSVSFYRNAYYLLVNSGAAALIGFFFWLVSARFYTAEDIGLASATISAIVLLATLADLGLSFGLIRFLPGASNRTGMINACFTLSVLASVFLGIVFLVGLKLWSPALLFLTERPLWVTLFFLYLLVSTVTVMGDRVFIAFRKAKFGLIRHLVIILEIPIAVGLAPLLGAAGLLLAVAAALWLSMVVTLFVFLPRVQPGYSPSPSVRWRAVTPMLRYSIGNHFSLLLLSVPTWIFPLLVLNFLGAAQNAYFYIAWTIGATLAGIPAAVSYSFFAEGSHDEKRVFSLGVSALKLSLLILAPAIALIFVIGNRLLLLFGQSYSEQGIRLLWVVALSALPGSFNQIYMTYKRVTKEGGQLLAVTGTIALLAVGAGYLLMPRFGVMGPGIGYLGAQTTVALWLGINLQREALRHKDKQSNGGS